MSHPVSDSIASKMAKLGIPTQPPPSVSRQNRHRKKGKKKDDSMIHFSRQSPSIKKKMRRGSAPALFRADLNLKKLVSSHDSREHDRSMRKLSAILMKTIACTPNLSIRLIDSALSHESGFARRFNQMVSKQIPFECKEPSKKRRKIKREKSKRFLFLLSGSINRALSSPSLLLNELNELESIGFDLLSIRMTLGSLRMELAKNPGFKGDLPLIFNQSCEQLERLFHRPNCQECGLKMIRTIPKRIGNARRHDPWHGFDYRRQTRSEVVSYCDDCRQNLKEDDVYFECPECGPMGVIRVIKGGRLRQILRKKSGSSVCLECVAKPGRKMRPQKKSRRGRRTSVMAIPGIPEFSKLNPGLAGIGEMTANDNEDADDGKEGGEEEEEELEVILDLDELNESGDGNVDKRLVFQEPDRLDIP